MRGAQYHTREAIILRSTAVLFNLIVILSCGSQVKAQPSSGHIFYARSCVRREYPSEAVEIVSFCTKSGRMSRKLGIGEIPFHHQVMSINSGIDDIQDPRYRVSRRTFFNLLLYYVRGSPSTWMALRARNLSPSGHATLNPSARAADLGQGLHLHPVSEGSPCVPRSREHAKRPAAGREKKMPKCQKSAFTHSNISISVILLSI